MTQNAAQAAIAAAVAKAASQINVNEATKGGGEYKQPELGLTVVTLIGYVETGVQVHKWKDDKGQQQQGDKDTALFIFELNGGKNKAEVIKKDDGTEVTIAKRMTVRLPISRNEKSGYFKLFKQLNYSGEFTHPAQCVGKHYITNVFGGKDNEGKEWRTLKNCPMQAPVVLDPNSGDERPIPAPQVFSEFRIFLWDYCDKVQWDALYIDGEYPAAEGKPAKSKNVFQNEIKGAKNFVDSPIFKIVAEEALALDDSPLAADPAATPATDALDVQPNVAGGSAEDPLASLL